MSPFSNFKAGQNVQGRLYQALLGANASATVAADGTAYAYVGPQGVGNIWYPTQVAVTCSNVTPTASPEAFLYIAPNLPLPQIQTLFNTNQVTLLGSTLSGGGDSIGLINITIPWGSTLLVKWTGGPVGGLAVMSVFGTQNATYFR